MNRSFYTLFHIIMHKESFISAPFRKQLLLLPQLGSLSPRLVLEPPTSCPVFESTHQHSPIEPWHCFSSYEPSSLQDGTNEPRRFWLSFLLCWHFDKSGNKLWNFLITKLVPRKRSKNNIFVLKMAVLESLGTKDLRPFNKCGHSK